MIAQAWEARLLQLWTKILAGPDESNLGSRIEQLILAERNLDLTHLIARILDPSIYKSVETALGSLEALKAAIATGEDLLRGVSPDVAAKRHGIVYAKDGSGFTTYSSAFEPGKDHGFIYPYRGQ